jgi:tetratricopeptide (TPR) repeat protein
MVENRTASPLSWLVLTSLAFTLPALAQDDSAPAFDLVQRDYDRLIADGEYLEAANSIKLILSEILQDPDYDGMVYGQLLTQLATAQHLAGSYPTAIENFELAVEAIELASDRLDGELIAPLLGMSRSMMADGRYLEAERSYLRTLHIHQVNFGFSGLDKAAIVDELSEAYFEMGDFEAANNMQKSYVTIVEHNYPGKNIERVPSLFSQAEMLYRTEKILRSLNAYKRLIALIEDADGPESMALLPAFTAIADILINNRIVDGEDGGDKAMRYLRRGAAITEKNENASDFDKAKVFIMMGDFLSVQTPDRDTVIDNYKRGWQYLDANPELHAYRDETFNNAVLLNPQPKGSTPAIQDLLDDAANQDSPKNGHIIIGYDVDEGGRPDNVRVVESVPEGLHDYVVKNHVRGFAFRPRFEAGEPVRSPNQTFELRFSFDEEELPEELRQNTTKVATADAIQ